MLEPAERQRYTAANRAAWNEVMPKHQAAAREKWDRAFAQPGYACLLADEVALWRRIGLEGQDVAHLCCNNGIELLSLKNLGAGRCVGFDISDEAIAEAAQRAERCGIACAFVRTDVYEIDAAYNAAFDRIYVTAGCLGWIPDLPALMGVAARLLRPGGRMLIHEIHPISEMLLFDDDENPDPLRISAPYFKREPYEEFGGLDYVGGSEYVSELPQYWFVHTIADIVTALLTHGLTVSHLGEHPRDISAGHGRVERAAAGVPLSFMLVADKAS